jgi:hypothetical protein
VASDVTIVNRALTLLGELAITAFTDDKKAARLATRDFADERDDLLSIHPWNFAMARASLPANASDPEWEFDYAYDFPVDALTIRKVNGEALDYGWHVEGRQIVTDLSAPLEIQYTRKITDANLMPPYFREALAAKLAWGWAETITGSAKIEDKKEKQYFKKLTTARTADGQEGTQGVLDTSTWLNARR